MDRSDDRSRDVSEFEDFLDLILEEISGLDAVEHFGVKGMRWGVRKDDSRPREPLKSLGPDEITRRTASGQTVTLSKMPPTKLHEFLGRRSKKYREEYANSAYFTIKDGAGKKIGEAEVAKRNDDELDLMWLGIDRSARGQGYATAVMKAGAEFGRRQGFKRLTLEVPTNSPDARHIYEKLGFTVDKVQSDKASDEDDPVWGGLTSMTLDFDSAAAHADRFVGDFLEHYGVKGMRWGVRNKTDREPASGDAVRTKELNVRARASGRDALSNQELQAAITRMNLEQQYDRLKPRTKSEKAARWIAGQLGVIGKEQASKFARDAVGDAIKNATKPQQ